MKVRLVNKQTVTEYADRNARSQIPLKGWLNTLKNAYWRQPLDIKNTFGSADLLGHGTMRVVFDIGGNNYRMICKYAFGKTRVHLFVYWIGTHAEYDKLCKDGKQNTIKVY